MKVLGIDPGLASTGIGVIQENGSKLTYVYHTCISTSKDTPLPERILHISNAINEVLKQYQPDIVSVEDIFFSKNTKTAMLVGQAKGAILLTAQQSGLPVFDIKPLEVKHGVVGSGAATKEQVQRMVQVILGLTEIPKPHHAADALAVAICGVQKAKFHEITY